MWQTKTEQQSLIKYTHQKFDLKSVATTYSDALLVLFGKLHTDFWIAEHSKQYISLSHLTNKERYMKKGFHCPECGTLGLRNLFIASRNGKSLALLLSSQADIRNSTGEAFCIKCKHIRRITDLQKKSISDV
jgi:ssDNA-binding Zn-finger/Zn-ribbon topoisomerase 1